MDYNDNNDLFCTEDFEELQKTIEARRRIEEIQRMEDVVNSLGHERKEFLINKIFTRKAFEQKVLQNITNKNEINISSDIQISTKEIFDEYNRLEMERSLWYDEIIEESNKIQNQQPTDLQNQQPTDLQNQQPTGLQNQQSVTLNNNTIKSSILKIR